MFKYFKLNNNDNEMINDPLLKIPFDKLSLDIGDLPEPKNLKNGKLKDKILAYFVSIKIGALYSKLN